MSWVRCEIVAVSLTTCRGCRSGIIRGVLEELSGMLCPTVDGSLRRGPSQVVGDLGRRRMLESSLGKLSGSSEASQKLYGEYLLTCRRSPSMPPRLLGNLWGDAILSCRSVLESCRERPYELLQKPSKLSETKILGTCWRCAFML